MEFNDDEFLKLVKELDLDWTNFMVHEHDYMGEFLYTFDVTPEDFLIFAKENINLKTKKGLIDGMSNAKRAIECQIDSIINFLGYDYKIFDRRNSYQNTKEFINTHFAEDTVDGITDRIKLLHILGVTPSFLISKIRSLRNKVEHEYIIPTLSEVKEAIEIAELFINSSMRKINWTIRGIYFGSDYRYEIRERYDGGNYTISVVNPKYLYIGTNNIKNGSIDLILIRKNNNYDPYDYNESSNGRLEIKNENSIYPYILLIFFTKKYHYLSNVLGKNLKKEHIKYYVQEP
ncbi:hypothetical protein [Paenibacillus polymyxa]|uniref:hypothetical protein n=1 Tax=Paenibacillus polymyxa TaxID=1406 RepID=UPI001FB2F55A|nr:hypothetical protein [Paenibacillus polymyxa]MCJ1220159.1 hypothetical protein [Paenibacillus polymyxa]